MMKKVFLFFSLLFAMAAQADVLGEYSFEGTLGDKIPVRLKFAVNGDEIAVGEIFTDLYLRRHLDKSEDREIAANEKFQLE